MVYDRDPHRPRGTAPRKARPRSTGPLPLAERLGRVWAFVFLGIVVLLAIVLVGKAFLAKGG